MSGGVVVCARCGHACGVDAWRARPAERTVTFADVAGDLSAWPGNAVVEVRPCARCAAPLARIAVQAAREPARVV
jgi:hypothetical protein